MFITLSNKDCTLSDPIDNRGGNLKVAVREFIYRINWFNISTSMNNNYILLNKKKIHIPQGYYNFCSLSKLLKKHIDLQLNSSNLRVSITTPLDTKYELPQKLSKQLGFATGFDKIEKNNEVTYIGKKELDLAINKAIYIHLDQLSLSENYLNGNKCQLLRTIAEGKGQFCDLETVEFINLQFKKLEIGYFEHLNISFTNVEGNPVEIKDFILVLEII